MGCLPKGDHPLQPLAAGPLARGTLEYHAQGLIKIEPGLFSLHTALSFKNAGATPIRIDLSHSKISVDGQPFRSCRFGQTVDGLVTKLQPNESANVQFQCRDIPKPVQRVELRFATSGTGAQGEVTVGFLGFGERP